MTTFASPIHGSGYGVMVAAPDLGSGDESRGGSSPPIRTSCSSQTSPGRKKSHIFSKKLSFVLPKFVFLRLLLECVPCLEQTLFQTGKHKRNQRLERMFGRGLP